MYVCQKWCDGDGDDVDVDDDDDDVNLLVLEDCAIEDAQLGLPDRICSSPEATHPVLIVIIITIRIISIKIVIIIFNEAL